MKYYYKILEMENQGYLQDQDMTSQKAVDPKKFLENLANLASNPLLSTRHTKAPRKRTSILQKVGVERTVLEEFEKEKKNQNNEVIPQSVVKTLYKVKSIERIEQSIVFYASSIFFILLTGTEIFYIAMNTKEECDPYLYFPSIILRIVFFFAGSCFLCKNKKVLFKLFFCFDVSLMAAVAYIAGIYGFIGIYSPHAKYSWVYFNLYLLSPVMYFSFLGYFRVMMVYCQWSDKQTLFTKFVLAIGAGSHIGVGLIFIISDIEHSLNMSSDLFKLIKGFLLLQSFSGLSLFLELFGMMDSIDGSANFRGTYELQLKKEDLEILYHGKKLRKNSKFLNRQSFLKNENNIIYYNGRRCSRSIVRQIFQDQKKISPIHPT